MGTILRIEWLNLKRDYVALALSFVLPVIFFSITALIFGGASFDTAKSLTLRVLAVDQDESETSQRFLRALDEERGIELVLRLKSSGGPARTISPEDARQSIFQGDHAAALIIPRGFGESFGSFAAGTAPIKLLYDSSNPIAKDMLEGLVQSAAMSSGWNRLVLRWLENLDERVLPGGAEERQALQRVISTLRALPSRESAPPTGSAATKSSMLVALVAEDVRGEQVDVMSYSAAGIGVMFLLFSMASAGGSILEEVETGTLERLLNSSVGMGRLLLAKWLFFALVAATQMTVMFVWGAVFFGVDLWTPKRLTGFLVMTLVTAAAAAAFGIFLATICKTRSQLGGISTILILVMSALGGSMVPRFLMPDFMTTISKFTFNGWALDGYLKVFWYGDPRASLVAALISLTPEVGVLGGMTVLLLTLAYLLSRRWTSI